MVQKSGLPSINQDDISIADFFYGGLGNGFSSKNNLLFNIAVNTRQEFALCLNREKGVVK